MGRPEGNDDEATAVERVANAARELRSASAALEAHLNTSVDTAMRTLSLARVTAAFNDLQAARDALDQLLARKRLH
ncbi:MULTISPECIES: hypothetical protein [unclassified Caballeronia]|nr:MULTISPECIES: hypothetical protein [unclassified Caballeronia]MDR5853140.1 hypothetical protein [Caballeronia sp. LZ003]